MMGSKKMEIDASDAIIDLAMVAVENARAELDKFEGKLSENDGEEVLEEYLKKCEVLCQSISDAHVAVTKE